MAVSLNFASYVTRFFTNGGFYFLYFRPVHTDSALLIYLPRLRRLSSPFSMVLKRRRPRSRVAVNWSRGLPQNTISASDCEVSSRIIEKKRIRMAKHPASIS
ncbi:MAG: hypothetical protein DWI02_07210 [Planctomycetota bacterium]|nr:MAG: hypothetical protein DWI02_07210 [Planctomycetota bacterium]